jgi:hypothetical protein
MLGFIVARQFSAVQVVNRLIADLHAAWQVSPWHATADVWSDMCMCMCVLCYGKALMVVYSAMLLLTLYLHCCCCCCRMFWCITLLRDCRALMQRPCGQSWTCWMQQSRAGAAQLLHKVLLLMMLAAVLP